LQLRIIIGEERQSDRQGLLHSRIGTALGAPRAVGLLGDVLADLGQVSVPQAVHIHASVHALDVQR
jgi:hypothetical protein